MLPESEVSRYLDFGGNIIHVKSNSEMEILNILHRLLQDQKLLINLKNNADSEFKNKFKYSKIVESIEQDYNFLKSLR
jgi:hypothetical protein